MKSTDHLEVQVGATRVATLDVTDPARIGLTYDPSWLVREDAFPISISLPLQDEPFETPAAHQFFANLLPERQARQAVCSRLGISVDNDIALLRAIGGECAGALSIMESGRSRRRTEESYERLTDARLAKLVGEDGGGPPTRLSLAQDKLPVALFDGELHLPLEGAPSTHILKLPNLRYRHLPLTWSSVTEALGR